MTRFAALQRRAMMVGSALAASLAIAGAAPAQDIGFEGQTVDIMVNFAAGGGTDTAARLLAPYIARHLPGNPGVIVTNKGGAGGTAAVEFLIDSVAPDGLHIGYFAGTPLRWALGMSEFQIISGYGTQGKMVAAARARETEMAQTNDSFFGANRDAITGDNVLEPLGQMGEYVDGTIVAQQGLEDIPVFDAIWRAHSPDTVGSPEYQAWETIHIAMSIQNIFVLPPNTPEEYIPVWEKAILAGLNDPEYLAQLKEPGVPSPAAVGTEAVRQRMLRLREAFTDPGVRAAIENAIAINMQ